MASYEDGKPEVIAYIMRLASEKRPKQQFKVLDVGACDGKWADYLQHAASMQKSPAMIIDAVEAWAPNAMQIEYKYRRVFCMEIQSLSYRKGAYDLAIFGDVIEHMTPEDARKVLDYALERCKEVIVGVPFRYPQGPIYGNPYERHIQDDLTHELFMERYPGFELLLQARSDYAYYRRAKI